MAPVEQIDFFSEMISAVLSIMGFGFIVLIFYLGGMLITILKALGSAVAETINPGLNKTVVDVILKVSVAAVVLIFAAPTIPPFGAVMETMLPAGDFNGISGSLANREGRFLINVIFNVVMEQIALAIAFFVPFIFTNMAVSAVETLLCDGDDENGVAGIVATFLADMVMLYAINACVLSRGTFFGVNMLNFLRSVELSEGLFPFLGKIILFMLIFFLAVHDLVTTDMLVAILSVNITMAVMDHAVTDENRLLLLGLAVVCGMGSRLIRRFFPETDSFVFDGIYGLVSAGVIGLITAGAVMLFK